MEADPTRSRAGVAAFALRNPHRAPLRIAQVAPLRESVPPAGYGGMERVVSYLTEELVRQGHDVTLFASGDSVTSARLSPGCPRSLREEGSDADPTPHYIAMLERVFRLADEFDLIHFHIELLQFPLAARQALPTLTTLHTRLDRPELRTCMRSFRNLPFVSVSNAQRRPMPWLNWRGTVYHGLPRDQLRFSRRADRYLAFVGRACPEMGLDRAIEIASRAGVPLRIAARVEPKNLDYFEARIEPMLRRPGIEYLGEIDSSALADFLARARALLYPIDWPEPFGLPVIESLACGTPVIAYPRGSMPELVRPGRNGFIVRNVNEAVAAIAGLDDLRRRDCRADFERRFTVERMVGHYVHLYHELVLGASRSSKRVMPGT